MEKSFSKIIKITKRGKSKVQCFTVENTHRILANNFYVSNCSVRHPDAENFIDAKLEQGKVTGSNISIKIDDEFMNCVLNDTPYIQKFPINSDNPKVTKSIDAKKLWKKIIYNAWKSAEPGVLFWDTVIRESVPDCYKEEGFTTISTNPCVVGDTIVSLADGRMGITIKELADDGKDVPVYCLDNNGKLCIRIMRNPRITGYNQQIYKVNIEGGLSFRVTGNHKFILKNNQEVEAKNLKNGDSLNIMTKYKTSYKSNRYYMLKHGFETIGEHRLIASFCENKKLLENEVVHHKDFNGLNNIPENLKIMTKKEHDLLHSKDMLGDKNPYHRMTNEWKFNFSSHKGTNNHKCYDDVINDDIKKHAIILTKKLNKRFSKRDWIDYAKNNKLPQSFSKYRNNELSGVSYLSKWSYIKLNMDEELLKYDPRIVKTYKSALENGYDTNIENNDVVVKKSCEYCKKKYWISYFNRESSFCSRKCSSYYINNNNEIQNKRVQSVLNYYENKLKDTKENQLKIYTDLKFKLNKEPLLKDWKLICKNNNISFRLGSKYGFKDYNELKQLSEFYNHKIISVELDGMENVYNGTVDDFHNFFISDKDMKINILTKNCGEIPLCPNDSCRLLAINLYNFVKNPFTKDAIFDWDWFKKCVLYAERFMDDIIDLEIEKIEKILEKIELDPEPEFMKKVEIEIWNKIMNMTKKGRRTGLGVTAEGDMLAGMGLIYGTPEATELSTKIHKTLAIEAYRSSCILAKERGTFPIYDYNKEINNPFINRLKNDDPELDEMLKKYGRRNISLLTIAPTGSVSILTQTTSGVEPVFLVSYKRRRKINPSDKDMMVNFIDDEGIKWQEYNVFHHKFEVWLKNNGYNIDEVKLMKEDDLKEIIKLSPYYKATSNDVDWVEKIKMQGSIQKYVDHSISVTVNLPKTATEEMVSQVYETGWSSGCKGVTVYRDGSRQGVIISNESKDKKTSTNNIPKRPVKLQCDVLRFVSRGNKWVGFVGLKEDDDETYPYEMFTGLADDFVIPNYVEKGFIRKEKIKDSEDNLVSRYDFIYHDKDGFEVTMQGLNRAFDREYWNIGKLVSGLLRHRMHFPSIIKIIESLKLDGDTLGTWKKGVIRILKRYIKEGEIEIDEECPVCKSKNLVHKEGCVSCLDCQWSKC